MPINGNFDKIGTDGSIDSSRKLASTYFASNWILNIFPSSFWSFTFSFLFFENRRGLWKTSLLARRTWQRIFRLAVSFFSVSFLHFRLFAAHEYIRNRTSSQVRDIVRKGRPWYAYLKRETSPSSVHSCKECKSVIHRLRFYIVWMPVLDYSPYGGHKKVPLNESIRENIDILHSLSYF